MLQPMVEITLHKEAIIRTMIDQGIYDVMMAQIARMEADPNRPFNALVCGEFSDGKGTVRFIQYHFHPSDPGWMMATITNACPAVVEVVRSGLAAGYTAPVKVMYVDDAKHRN